MYILPPRLLQITVTSSVILSTWTETDTTNNKWINQPYEWTITFSVTTQKHSCPITRVAYQYNGQDIQVGDWVSTSVGGAVFQIINIQSASVDTVVANVCDIDRLSLMLDKTARGNIKPTVSIGYCFQLNDQGQPILLGTSTNYMPNNWQSDIQSRFAYRNESIQNIFVTQTGHSFKPGDIISPDLNNVGKYILASAENELSAIGTVKDIGIPSTKNFTFRPFGKIMYNISPPFPGNYGDIYYLDPANPGKLTTKKPANHSKPIYIQIDTTTGIVLDDNTPDDPIKYHITDINDGQTSFVLPTGTLEVLEMTINGIETDNYTYDVSTLTLTFDPVGNGYGIDSSDEVVLTYKV